MSFVFCVIFPLEKFPGVRKESQRDSTGVRKEGGPKVHVENTKIHFKRLSEYLEVELKASITLACVSSETDIIKFLS